MSAFVPRNYRHRKPSPVWLAALECGALLWWVPLAIVTPFVRGWPDGTPWMVVCVLSGSLMAALFFWLLKKAE